MLIHAYDLPITGKKCSAFANNFLLAMKTTTKQAVLKKKITGGV
jgi:hypothetical protein